MKLFISHSLAPTDLQVAALLNRQAQAKGISVDSSQHHAVGATLVQVIQNAIFYSDFVIAIVSLDSPYTSNVQQELSAAASLGKPSLALVERGVRSLQPIIGIQYVEFERLNLGPALARISAILEGRKNQENLGKWIIGGGLALLALYLISKSE
jgi:TIR domain